MKSGLRPIRKDHRDFSFHKTYGSTLFDAASLPADFSIDGGYETPNQEMPDMRFSPALPPLPYGCTGETTTYLCQVEDSQIYNPQFTYLHTPPYDSGGRDIRDALQSAKDTGVQDASGTIGNKRAAYFNVMPSGAIDWFDSVRIALWVNQQEKRAVSIGSWWYPEWSTPTGGILPTPSFNTATATLHNHAVFGWKTMGGFPYLCDKSWQGTAYADGGICYFSRELFNAIMAQKYTGAFTISKVPSNIVQKVQLGVVATLVSFIRTLFNL